MVSFFMLSVAFLSCISAVFLYYHKHTTLIKDLKVHISKMIEDRIKEIE